MRSLRIVRYDPSLKQEWDRFVIDSKNGTFLFQRDYMDYHADRFTDHSLMFYEGEKLVALMPANLRGGVLHSHEGLSYGGIVSGRDMRQGPFLDLFSGLLSHLREQGIRELRYKAMPHIYHRLPSDEDLYALFRHGAELYRRDVNTVLFQGESAPWQTLRKRMLNKARKHGVRVEESGDYASFMPVLERVLAQRHGLKPVHTLEEITLLASRFPRNIRLFTACLEGELLAGVVIYEHDTVAHAQYTANSEKGMELGALDMIFHYLIAERYRDKRYISFGVSTEDEGRRLNLGLAAYKEGFGARTVVHDFYRIALLPPSDENV